MTSKFTKGQRVRINATVEQMKGWGIPHNEAEWYAKRGFGVVDGTTLSIASFASPFEDGVSRWFENSSLEPIEELVEGQKVLVDASEEQLRHIGVYSEWAELICDRKMVGTFIRGDGTNYIPLEVRFEGLEPGPDVVTIFFDKGMLVPVKEEVESEEGAKEPELDEFTWRSGEPVNAMLEFANREGAAFHASNEDGCTCGGPVNFAGIVGLETKYNFLDIRDSGWAVTLTAPKVKVEEPEWINDPVIEATIHPGGRAFLFRKDDGLYSNVAYAIQGSFPAGDLEDVRRFSPEIIESVFGPLLKASGAE